MRDMEVKAMTLKNWAGSSVGHLAGDFHVLLKESDTETEINIQENIGTQPHMGEECFLTQLQPFRREMCLQ